MKLMTKELEEKFKNYPLYSQDGLLGRAKVIVKFFNPVGPGTWLITEANKLENGDYQMFGYCHLGDDEMAELGYVRLSELEELKLPFGFSVERDVYLSKDCDLIQAMKETSIRPPTYMLKEYEKYNQKKAIIVDFFKQILEQYDFNLLIDEDMFMLEDLQGGNLGNIEQEKFVNLKNIIERLDNYHEDYIYKSLNEREKAQEVINESDWDLVVKKYLESDEINEILSEIQVKDYNEIKSFNGQLSIEKIIKVINGEEFDLENDDIILSKVNEYFKENNTKNLMEYGSDKDEGLYKLSSLYKEIIDKLDIKYKKIFTEDISDGKYLTTVILENDEKLNINTEAWNSKEIIVENIKLIYENAKQKEKNTLENENDFDYDY